jgi:Domain of unknown function (DUF2017)
MALGQPFRRVDEGFDVALDGEQRSALAHLADEFHELLASETPSSDASLQRLFPPAHPDDLLENLEFERRAGAGLLDGKLAAHETLRRTTRSDRLTEEEILAWMTAINDMRLVIGTRIDVQEDSDPDEFADDPEREASFQLYVYLTWLLEMIVEALGEPDA